MAGKIDPALGCAFALGAVLAAPFIIAAVPVLFGITLGVLAFIAVGLLIRGVIWCIFH
jgi:hypothetical protein